MAVTLEQLLRAATVRIEGGPRPGAGFFVAPGQVVTCAHVVGTQPEVRVRWQAHDLAGRVELRLCDQGRPIPNLDEDYPDTALITVSCAGHGCVAIDEDVPAHGDRFQAYGFPAEGGSVVLTAASMAYRGTKGEYPTEFIDLDSDTVKPGMSGGPLLNLRTRGVCGIVVATRHPARPEGGLAVGWVAVAEPLGQVLKANRAFHRQHPDWRRTARPPGRRVRFGLPHVSAHFTGRDTELDALERTLASEERAVVTQAISGLGGVGKTQLAARYAHLRADEYDIMAWIRAEDGGIADLAQLAVELGVDVDLDDLTPAERAGRAVRWLGSCDERWLLVLDNVPSADMLAAMLPSTGNGRVLATTRSRTLDQFGPVLSLDVFDVATGAAYLTARATRPDDDHAARRLSRALGGLALALAHAGAYCQAGTSFDDYLELLTGLPASEMFAKRPEASYTETVASTWQVSIHAATDQAPLARSILESAAYLAPDGIPITLLDVLIDDRDDVRQRKRLRDGLNALHHYSLADVADTTISVHRLLQKVIRDDARMRNDNTGAVGAFTALSNAFPAYPGPWGSSQAQMLFPHLLALIDAPIVQERAPQALELLHAACRYVALGPFGSTTLTDREPAARDYVAVGPLGLTTLTAREAAARRLLIAEQAARLATEQLDGDDLRTLRALDDLAFAYMVAGRFGDAINPKKRVLAWLEQVAGPEDDETLTALCEVALYCAEAGRFDEAIVLQERLLAAFERQLGPEEQDTVTARSRLAALRRRKKPSELQFAPREAAAD